MRIVALLVVLWLGLVSHPGSARATVKNSGPIVLFHAALVIDGAFLLHDILVADSSVGVGVVEMLFCAPQVILGTVMVVGLEGTRDRLLAGGYTLVVASLTYRGFRGASGRDDVKPRVLVTPAPVSDGRRTGFGLSVAGTF